MVTVDYRDSFLKLLFKIKDNAIEQKLKKQIAKIISNPLIGKPMMYARKGTRELYIAPYRLSYVYIKEADKIVFLDLYHKDEQ